MASWGMGKRYGGSTSYTGSYSGSFGYGGAGGGYGYGGYGGGGYTSYGGSSQVKRCARLTVIYLGLLLMQYVVFVRRDCRSSLFIHPL